MSGITPVTKRWRARIAGAPGGGSIFYMDNQNGAIVGGYPISQVPLNADSVFNYYYPDFSPGGALATAGLTAPELQIATETSVADNTGVFDQLLRGPRYIQGPNNVTDLASANKRRRELFPRLDGPHISSTECCEISTCGLIGGP